MTNEHEVAGGKKAENWSRPDGIRGGAVTGPWRSAPRVALRPGEILPVRPLVVPEAPEPGIRAAAQTEHAEEVARFAVEPARTPTGAAPDGEAAAGFPPVLRPSTPATAREMPPRPRPAGAPAPGSHKENARRKVTGRMAGPAIPRWAGRPPSIWIGGAAAVVALGGLVVWLLWPSGVPSGAAPAETTSSAAVATMAPTGENDTVAGLADIVRVRLRVSETLPEARRQAIVAGLKRAGVRAEIDVTPLLMTIGTTRVGYYQAQDKGKAEALAQVAAGVLGTDAPPPVRDYAKLDNAPEAGTIELWVQE